MKQHKKILGGYFFGISTGVFTTMAITDYSLIYGHLNYSTTTMLIETFLAISVTIIFAIKYNSLKKTGEKQ